MLLVAGAAIAPTYAASTRWSTQAAPAGTVTEAFAWLATAVGVGAAVGAAAAGRCSTTPGPSAAFALAGGAGALAILATLLRSRTLAPRQAPVITLIDTDIGEQFADIEAFYNPTRRHSTLGYLSPAQFELRASRSDIKTMRLETETT